MERKDDYKVKVNGREDFEELKSKIQEAFPGYIGENGICILAVSSGLEPEEVTEAWILTWVKTNADYVENKLQEILSEYEAA